MKASAFPLCWPSGWKSTLPRQRKKSRYRVTLARARAGLGLQTRLLGAKNVIVSTDIPLRRDGLPYLRFEPLANPGVAVYWTQGKTSRVIACDVWQTIDANMRAVELTVGALRQIERAGASEILDRAFTGFNALPPGANDDPLWWARELELDWPCSRVAIMFSYKKLAHAKHPDRGGSHVEMSRLNEACEAALEAVEGIT